MENSDLKIETTVKRKRSAPRYWVVIKGKLYARLQYRDDNDKSRVKYKPIADKRTAQRVVNEMRRELNDHGQETLHSDKMTFQELADKYEKIKLVKASYSNGIKVSGKRSLLPLKSALKPLLQHFSRKAIRAIKTSDIEGYKSKRLNTPVEKVVKNEVETTDSKGKKVTKVKIEKIEKPRAVATVNRELELLRTILNFAVQNQWLIRNPFDLCKGVISKAAEVERDRILSLDEEERLLKACGERVVSYQRRGKEIIKNDKGIGRKHIKPIFICALDTGMRRGEMFKMRWKDVNFTTGEIYIPQTNTKTEEARTVGMTIRLRDELEQLWQNSPKRPDDLVFGVSNTIKTAWETACRIAEVKNFRLHDCRHTATTRMISSGSAHTEVMKITGHTQLKTFLRYLNITNETAKSVATKLDNYLSSVQSQENLVVHETIN
jgi:integrase